MITRREEALKRIEKLVQEGKNLPEIQQLWESDPFGRDISRHALKDHYRFFRRLKESEASKEHSPQLARSLGGVAILLGLASLFLVIVAKRDPDVKEAWDLQRMSLAAYSLMAVACGAVLSLKPRWATRRFRAGSEKTPVKDEGEGEK